MLRRLEKRILVDLPTYEARKAMFKHHLPRVVNPSEGGLELLSDLDYDMLALVSTFYISCEIKVHLYSCCQPVTEKIKRTRKNCMTIVLK